MSSKDPHPIETKHDLIVLSDLHLGEGLLEGEPRYSPTEDFFHDKQFANFLAKLRRDYDKNPDGLVLVLNGDVFDFLTVTRVPTEEEAKSRGFNVLPAEKDFGLNPTAEKSVYKLDVIVAGHKLFFTSLARFLKAGFKVIILPGNHDLELHFEEVRNRFLEHLTNLEQDLNLSQVVDLVEFRDWFYFEPGRVYIEHGNQYDSTNSIRYPFRPILSEGRWWKAEPEETLDYPLGSIFVRFFYNRVRRLDPYTPRLLSFEQYLDFVQRYNLFDVWRVYKDHYPHFIAALGSTATSGGSRSSEAEDARQAETFKKLQETDEHGYLYEGLSELKIHPASASKPHVVKEMMKPVIRRSLWLGLFAFIALFVWVGVFQLIDKIPWFTANTFLMSLFAVVTLGAAFWTWIHLQRKLRRKSASSAVEHYVERAEKIADLTDAPMVLMGHSHRVDYRRIRKGQAVYANGGTWTSVDNPWSRIMRDARRLTFLYVKGSEVELCRFNDDACRFDDVPLFYLDEEQLPDVVPLDTTFTNETRAEHSWLPSSDFSGQDEDYPE